MNKNIQFFVIFFLLIIDQSIAQTSSQVDATKLDDNRQPIIYREYGILPLPLENAIDPENYFLGPGDRLRILWSVENIDNFVTIGPTGKLIIPKIGPISVIGKTLGDVDQEVNERIRKGVNTSEIDFLCGVAQAMVSMERNNGLDEDTVMGCVPPRWIFSAIRNESIFKESEEE